MCCVNRAGLWFPCDFRFWVSWHADFLPGWAEKRPGAELWGVREWPGVRVAEVAYPYGSSSMIAVQMALSIWKYARVVIVGVHLSGLYEGYRSAWRPVKRDFGGRIKAIGGYTEQLFGRPNAAWVEG